VKILFTSDLHGVVSAFERYAHILAGGDYTIGIISGDILDDSFKPEEMDEYVADKRIDADDYLIELPGEEETFDDYADRQLEKLYDPDWVFIKMLTFKEEKVKEILNNRGKPVYIIPGNHDLTRWTDSGNIINIHGKRIDLDVFNLVGYRWTPLDRTEEEQKRDIRKLKRLVDENTILVTHAPPSGIMESELLDTGQTISYGSRAIRRMVDKKTPRLNLFGHVHGRFGREGIFINGSFPQARQFVEIDVEKGTVNFIDSGITENWWE
jgi:Icc-related predicted phosphoesterase